MHFLGAQTHAKGTVPEDVRHPGLKQQYPKRIY
jgi:hypothetical protein